MTSITQNDLKEGEGEEEEEEEKEEEKEISSALSSNTWIFLPLLQNFYDFFLFSEQPPYLII